MTDNIRFNSICRRNGLELSEGQIETLQTYIRLLLEWNTKINLISRNDTANIWFNHILHSLSILFFVELRSGLKILDLGTGGGLPGIPLAIARDDLKFTLVDSTRKKMMTIEDMVGKLNLGNVGFVTGRAETLGESREFARKYDVVVSRAVAQLKDLVRWSRPLLKSDDARLIALKGGDMQNELDAARFASNARNIEVRNLVFDGSEEIGLEGKKIVTVYL